MSTAPSAGESRFGYHRVTTWQTCKRKYAYKYAAHLEPTKLSPPLALGSMVHLALMHFYSRRAGRGGEDPVQAMFNAPARMAWCFERAKAIYQGYVEWAARNDHFLVLDVEREYEVRLGEHVLTARIDLVTAEAGCAVAIDHKTGGGEVASVGAEWRRRGQTAVLASIGASVFPDLYGMPWGGVTINAISTRDGADPAAHRPPLRIAEEWRRNVVRGLYDSLGEMAGAPARYGADPYAYPCTGLESCRGRYDWCEYQPLCLEGRDAEVRYDRVRDDMTALRETAGR